MGGEFTVTRVHDGETVRVEGHDVEIVVRLAGVEVPDTAKGEEGPAHQLALEAKSQLAEWTLNRTVEIEGHGLDEFNRVIGFVCLEGVNINLEMIKEGYARVYNKEPLHGVYLLPYLKAEEIARRSDRGIWRLSDLHIWMFNSEK
jgi:endonuclease YncB( thermonuclease family)